MFYAVAAAVIGGTSLFGGSGTIIGAALGVLVLAILNLGFTLQGISAYTFDLVLGLAIIVSMALNVTLERIRQSGRLGALTMSETRSAATPVDVRTAATRSGSRTSARASASVTALEDVSLHLGQGEVLGLIGDNGAGKSTLVKILTGFHKPDAGKIFVLGEEVQLKSVTHARSLGIDTVFQDLALVPGMSVYHNMFLNREVTRGIGPLRFLNNRAMRKRSREYLDDIGVRVPSMDAEVARISGGQRQAIAIARSTHSDAKILLLDEPLAAMGAREGALIIELIAGAEAARRRLDDRDRAQLRARARDVRPGQPAPERPHHARQARPTRPRSRS